jgi:hypothetical protein
MDRERTGCTTLPEDLLNLPVAIEQSFHLLGDLPGRLDVHGYALYDRLAGVHPQKSDANRFQSGDHRA